MVARRGSRGARRSRRTGEPSPEETICAREGCSRPRPHNREFPYCSLLCRAVVERMDNTEQLCRALGPSPQSTAIWVAAVALNDAVTDLYAAQRGAVKVLKADDRADSAALAS